MVVLNVFNQAWERKSPPYNLLRITQVVKGAAFEAVIHTFKSYIRSHVTLAQSVEHQTFNLVVIGSNPICHI